MPPRRAQQCQAIVQQTDDTEAALLESNAGIDNAIGPLPLGLPPFWPRKPQVWFVQVEAHFRLQRIAAQIAHSYYVVASLPTKVADEIKDVLSQPPPYNAYDDLKSVSLARTVVSEHSQIWRLLAA